jgi:hypothetical protein
MLLLAIFQHHLSTQLATNFHLAAGPKQAHLSLDGQYAKIGSPIAPHHEQFARSPIANTNLGIYKAWWDAVLGGCFGRDLVLTI